MSFNLGDYVDVAQRIEEFYGRYPEGSLRTGTPPQVLEIGGRSFIVYHALAFRAPDDPCPAEGWAWEPVPGPTQFTKDSELMNAETAAWGRAIVAAGFKTKKIASADEIRNRSGEPTAAQQAAATVPQATGRGEPASPDASFEQRGRITVLVGEIAKLTGKSPITLSEALRATYGPLDKLSAESADELVGKLERRKVRGPDEQQAIA